MFDRIQLDRAKLAVAENSARCSSAKTRIQQKPSRFLTDFLPILPTRLNSASGQQYILKKFGEKIRCAAPSIFLIRHLF